MNKVINLDNNSLNLDKEDVRKIEVIISRYFSDLEKLAKEHKIDGFLCTDYLLAIGECFELFDDQEKWLEISYMLMTKLKIFLHNNISKLGIGLFSGLSYIGMSIKSIEEKTGYYQKLLNSVNDIICDNVDILCDYATSNLKSMRADYYDLINGLSGVGIYLLECSDIKKNELELKKILTFLVSLVLEKINIDGIQVPCYYIDRDNQFRDDEKELFPKGNFNFSVSHGIASVGNALAKAYSKGIKVENQMEAINQIIHLYYTNGMTDKEDGIIYWPSMLPFENFISNNTEKYRSKRQSWCYGAIGISGNFVNIARLIGDKKMEHSMYDNICKIAKNDVNNYELTSPIICHGYAGVLSILITTYKNNPCDLLYKRIIDLIDKLISMYNPSSLYGYLDTSIKYNDGKATYIDKDNNSFLEGTTGIILTLISAFKKEVFYEKLLLLK